MNQPATENSSLPFVVSLSNHGRAAGVDLVQLVSGRHYSGSGKERHLRDWIPAFGRMTDFHLVNRGDFFAASEFACKTLRRTRFEARSGASWYPVTVSATPLARRFNLRRTDR